MTVAMTTRALTKAGENRKPESKPPLMVSKEIRPSYDPCWEIGINEGAETIKRTWLLELVEGLIPQDRESLVGIGDREDNDRTLAFPGGRAIPALDVNASARQ